MKYKNFLQSCLLLLLMVCVQTVWAAQGDKTTYQISWSHANLNSLTDGKFVKQSGNGLINVSMYGEYSITYRDDRDIDEFMSKGVGRLVMGDQKEGTTSHTLSWSAAQTGYSLTAVEVGTLVRSYGAGNVAWLKLGAESETQINWAVYNSTTHVTTSNIAATATSVPMVFRRDATLKREYNMTKLQLDMYIIPDAPTWKKATDDVKVTVNHTEDAYLHWIDLSSYISIGNSAFAGTVKYEAVGLDAKYIVWNDTHDKCYIIKPGTYQFRAYIDKKDGVYCSSAYTANYLTLTAAADLTEQANAQIFYMVDDQLVSETDKTNHVWEVSLVGPSNDHWVEYIYAFDGDLLFERQTTSSIGYLSDTYNRKDHFNVYAMGGVDSTIVTNSAGGARSWLRINSTKADNHVTFTINSQAMYNALMTSVSHQEGDDVFWDNNRIRFAHFNNDYSRKRTLEITFLGVPDSLIMLYGNNSEQQSGNTHLSIEYYDGAWHDFTMIDGRPDGSSADKAKRFAYQLPASASKLRFAYWGAQNLGFIHDLTVTERKGFTMGVALDSVLCFSGVHQKGGVEVKDVDLKWYNLYPSFQDTLHGFNPDQFVAQPSGIKPLALDDYQENGKVQLGLKLDSAGVFTTYYMVWNGTPDTKVVVPGGKSVYGFMLKGVVKYSADELELKNTLPSDTVRLEQGDKLPNPFQLQDSTGKVLTDSLNYQYDFLPSNSAEIDSLGNIVAKCVGYTRVIATLKENSLIPGGLKDTLYLYVAEQEPNKIVWNIPTEGIGRKDVVTNLATAADSATISYAFNPAFATDLGNNTIQIADTIGDMFVTATAAQTCDHLKKDSTILVKILDIIEDKQVKVKDSTLLKDIVPGDSIKDLVVILDEKGDTLVPPAIQTTYQFIPAGSAKVVDGSIIVINHAIDPIVVIATTTGKDIKTRIDTIYLHPKHDWEEIQFTKAMLDTMFVNKEYPLGGYITTKSGNGADTLFVAESLASKVYFHQGKRTATPKDTGVVVINAVAYGNADYWGPDTATHKVALVYAVKNIDWKDALKPLDLQKLKIISDTIPTSTVPVLDGDGKDITDEVTKSYEIIPNPNGDATITPDGDIVMTQAGDVMLIITISGPGFETKKDTLYMHADGYQVGSVDLGVDVSNLHIGDSISMDNVKVYDVDGNDITATQVDSIGYEFDPKGSATYDPATNTIIVKKDGTFSIIPVVTGALLNPNPARDTITASAVGYQVGYIDLGVSLNDLRVGDSISMDNIKIYDNGGNDITDTKVENIRFEFTPAGFAKYDPATNTIIILKEGDFSIIPVIGGSALVPNPTRDTIPTSALGYRVGYVDLGVDLSNLHVGDVISMDNATVFDVDSNDITATKVDGIRYEISPTGMAKYDATTNTITILKEGNFSIIPVITGSALVPNPSRDTIPTSAVGYKVGEVVLPAPLDEIHVGDAIPLDGAKVYDKDGNDITDSQVDTIIYKVVPSDAVIYDPTTNSYIVLKAEPIQIIAIVKGANLVPNPATDTIEVEIKNYGNIQIEFPTKPAGEEYLPGDTINLDDIKILDEKGKDISDLCDQKISWEPKENAHLDKEGNLVLDKYGDLDIKVQVTGEGIDSTTFNDTIPVQPVAVGKVEYPAIPQEGYHVGDVINTDSIKVYDKDGNDITNKAEITYTFVPSDGAHVDPKTGDIVIDKSGNIVIQTNIGGDVVEEFTDEEEINVKKYETGEIILPERPGDEDYEVGDKITKDSIKVLDKDGNDISDEAIITITWEPTENAHLDSKGNLVFDHTGKIIVTVCVSGEAVTEKCTEETYIIRHNEDGCHNLMIQVQNDVLVINNSEEEHIKQKLPQFVSYQWYRDEELLSGEVNQDYHISAGEIKDSSYYYAYGMDITGKKYLICEMVVKEASAPVASTSFKVYPTLVATSETYTVEVEQAGILYVTNSTGSAISSQKVTKGKNVITAPQITGVYVLQFAPQIGKYEVQKLTVK